MSTRLLFPIVLFLFQILLLGLFASGWVTYEVKSTEVNTKEVNSTDDLAVNVFYPQFQDIHVMIFVGFGLLMTFLQKYGFSAISYNLLLSAVTIQWATLLNAWIKQRIEYHLEGRTESISKIEINVLSLITSDFTAASVLITFGAVLGKTTRFQLLIIAIVEPIFYAINETIIMHYLKIADVGGSLIIHLFGAYFGLTVATLLQNHGGEHPNESSSYQSDIFSMIGTLFLWMYWPSFNGGPDGSNPNLQSRGIINTYFSLAACVATTFVVSSIVHKKWKLNMVHIQNATLAGGVAIGTAANLMIKPWGAILTGMISGVISVLGYTYVTPFLKKYLKIHDTCGVHNLHGMPAVFAGLVGSVAAASIPRSKYPGEDFTKLYVEGDHRSSSTQAGYQFAAVCVSFCWAVGGGLITGVLCLIAGKIDKMDERGLYNDDIEFHVPEAIKYQNMNNGNDREMKVVSTHA